MTHASNTIRMAIGIGTAHTFTIRELFATLCEVNCSFCAKPGPYIDVFALKRRCLGLNGHRNDEPLFPMMHRQLSEHNIDTSNLSSVSSFNSIPGHYWGGTSPHRSTFYDPNGILPSAKDMKSRADKRLMRYVGNLHYCCVVAPWISNTSMTAREARTCTICHASRPTISSFLTAMSAIFGDSPPFFDGLGEISTDDSLEEHMEREHGSEGKDI